MGVWGIIKQVGCPACLPKPGLLEDGVTLWKSCRRVEVYAISSPMHAHKHMGEREKASSLHAFAEAQEERKKRDV